MQRTRKQHFIPRMILKNHTRFEIPMRFPLIYQYEEETEKEHAVRIDNICYKDYLYEYRDDNGNIVDLNLIEKTFSVYEGKWDKIIRSLKNRPELTREDLAFLYLLFPLQIMRMPEMLQLTSNWLKSTSPELSEIESQRYARILSLVPGQLDIKRNIILAKWTEMCCKRLLQIYITDGSEPFILNGTFPVTGIYTGDEPVKNAEMYYPVSSDICLGLIDARIINPYKDVGIDFIRKFNQLSINKDSRFLYSAVSIKDRISEYPLLKQKSRIT